MCAVILCESVHFSFRSTINIEVLLFNLMNVALDLHFNCCSQHPVGWDAVLQFLVSAFILCLWGHALDLEMLRVIWIMRNDNIHTVLRIFFFLKCFWVLVLFCSSQAVYVWNPRHQKILHPDLRSVYPINRPCLFSCTVPSWAYL